MLNLWRLSASGFTGVESFLAALLLYFALPLLSYCPTIFGLAAVTLWLLSCFSRRHNYGALKLPLLSKDLVSLFGKGGGWQKY